MDRRAAVRAGFIGVFCALGALCACAPGPHFDQIAPEVSGTVSVRGVPQVGIPVSFDPRCRRGAGACQGAVKKTVTDARGRFAFAGVREFSFFVWLGDPGGCWEVCLQPEGRTIAGMRDEWFGMYPPAETRIECDLGKGEPKNRPAADETREMGVSGVCGFADGWSPWAQFRREHPKTDSSSR